MRQRRIDRGAITLASAEVKFQIDTETHDPLDIGMLIFFTFSDKISSSVIDFFFFLPVTSLAPHYLRL